MNKKFMKIICGTMCFLGLTSCNEKEKKEMNQAEEKSITKLDDLGQSKKILITYYSYSGNTKEIANQIKEFTGGDLVEILPEKPYPSNYDECVDLAKKEINEDFKPKITTKIENVKDYDVIFVGSPNWWNTIAPPVATFLNSHDLSGKIVIPFVTHGGGRIGRCETDIIRFSPSATVLKTLYLSGSSAKKAQSKVKEFLQKNKIIK